MTKILTSIALLILTNFAFGQTNYEKFISYSKAKDTTNIKKLLSNWGNEKNIDAEFYVCALNYYFDKSHIEIISIESQPKNDGKDALKLTAEDGKEYFMNSNSAFDDKLLSKTISYATEGIKKFPNRLDLRFGKCYILKEMQDYKNFTTELIETIEYSKTNNNEWLWSENKKKENGKEFFLKTIYDYEAELYNTNNDDLLNNIIEIGTKTIQYYPTEVEIISITAVAYTLQNNFDKAIEYLKLAEKLNAKDYIVLGNIAQTYKRKGDKENAIKYFELYKKYGDKQAQEDANKELNELRK